MTKVSSTYYGRPCSAEASSTSEVSSTYRGRPRSAEGVVFSMTKAMALNDVVEYKRCSAQH